MGEAPATDEGAARPAAGGWQRMGMQRRPLLNALVCFNRQMHARASEIWSYMTSLLQTGKKYFPGGAPPRKRRIQSIND
jgi:hypothetical protein